MTKRTLFTLIAIVAVIGVSFSQIRITEAMSSSGTGGTPDWVELTNHGTADVDITGWKIDDNSFSFATSLALNGVTSIPAGKSVIFIETANPGTDIPAFKAFWGSSVDNVAVGSYTGSGIGLGSGGDGVIIFTADGTEIHRVSFGAATTGASFYWTFTAAGVMVADAVVSTAGTLTGAVASQVTLTSANVLANVGSPGTALLYASGTNVDKLSSTELAVSPNPFSTHITLSSNESIASVQLTNLTGQRMQFSNFDNQRIDTQHLPAGIYLLSVEFANGTRTDQKLIKR
jgi:hypothetical protein